MPEPDLERLLNPLQKRSLYSGACLSTYRRHDGFSVAVGFGDLGPDKPYFAASTTKLYLTAVLLQLVDEGRIALDQTLAQHVPASLLTGLNCQRNEDLSSLITIKMAMSHTSGLPDYFQHKVEKRTLQARVSAGEDQAWSVEDVVEMVRDVGALHPPGVTKRASYSDTNYQLLGRLIEEVEATPLNEVMAQRLFAPLGLEQTYLYSDPSDECPHPLRFRNHFIHVPQAMTSFRGDGSLVTTASEAMVFLRAFLDGRLFNADRLPALFEWRPMFFPLHYGAGLMSYRLPAVLTGFSRHPRLLGHSGLSGAFLFAAPDAGVFLTGTVNQIHKPSTSFQLMTRALAALKSRPGG